MGLSCCAVLASANHTQNTNSLLLILQLPEVESEIQVVLERDFALLKAVPPRTTVNADDVVRHLQATVFLVSDVRAEHPRMGASAPIARLAGDRRSAAN